MAGLAIPGRLGVLEVSDDGGSTFSGLGGIVDINMPINVDELECTSHDSAGAREYIPNHHDVTMDISARWLDGDPGQEIVLLAVFAKTVFNFQYFMEKDPASGKKVYTGTAFATTTDPTAPLDDTAGLSVTLRCSGVLQGTQT